LLGQLLLGRDRALEPRPPALGEARRLQRLGEKDRVALGRLGRDDQDLPGGLDLDGEVAPVVGRQAVLPDDLHVSLIGPQPKARLLELDLRGLARLDRHGLVAALGRLALARELGGGVGLEEIQLDRPFSFHAEGIQFGFDPQRALVGDDLAGQPQFPQGKIQGLGDPHVDHVKPGVGQLPQPLLQSTRSLARPGHAGQVAEDVDLLARQVALGEQAHGFLDRGGERLGGRGGLQALDAVPGRPEVHLERPAARAAVEHRHLALRRQLGQQPEGHVLGGFEPGAVLVPVLHPLRGVEHQGGSDRGPLAPQAAPRGLQARPRQGQRHQRDQCHPQRQQQQVAEAQLPPVRVVPPRDKAQRGKLHEPRPAAHHQVEHDRQRHQRRPGQQGEVQKGHGSEKEPRWDSSMQNEK